MWYPELQSFDPRFDRFGTVQMIVNGLMCTLNLPKARQRKLDAQGDEAAVALPEYGGRPAFLVDEFDAQCPATWMRGSPHASSYFVPVKVGHGLWLDFNHNLKHAYDVAVRISSQGVCALTALPTKDRMHLEQYRENCPTHGVKFGAERFCKECGFKWPPQNYLATNAQPRGFFWLDGFFTKGGVTRQFVFTTNPEEGVAAQILGDERVFAIGIAFYLSKEPKQPAPPPRFSMDGFDNLALGAAPQTRSFGAAPAFHRRATGAAPAKQIEIKAGARINQRVHTDPRPIDYWATEPAGVIYVNYCSEETAREILGASLADRIEHEEGPLHGLKVGHPSPTDQ